MTPRAALAAAVAATSLWAAPVAAFQCTGEVVGVRPISQYNHDGGNGFLAVRKGAGTNHAQVGELYLGDQVWVAERQGNWVYVGCLEGLCMTPYWGMPMSQGWAYGKYLRYSGTGCP